MTLIILLMFMPHKIEYKGIITTLILSIKLIENIITLSQPLCSYIPIIHPPQFIMFINKTRLCNKIHFIKDIIQDKLNGEMDRVMVHFIYLDLV